MAYNWILEKMNSQFYSLLHTANTYGWALVSKGNVNVELVNGEKQSFDFNVGFGGIEARAKETLNYAKNSVKKVSGSVTVGAPERRGYRYDFVWG